MRRLFSKPDTHNQCLVKRFVSTYDFRGTWVEIHDRAIQGGRLPEGATKLLDGFKFRFFTRPYL